MWLPNKLIATIENEFIRGLNKYISSQPYASARAEASLFYSFSQWITLILLNNETTTYQKESQIIFSICSVALLLLVCVLQLILWGLPSGYFLRDR